MFNYLTHSFTECWKSTNTFMVALELDVHRDVRRDHLRIVYSNAYTRKAFNDRRVQYLWKLSALGATSACTTMGDTL